MAETLVLTLADFLLARIAEDEAAARDCADMFPPPWEVADRGWRVRIYASDAPTPDLMSDDEGAMTVRSPVVMEVEPDRHIQDARWLSERVEHIARWDPDRVLAECDAKRRIVKDHKHSTETRGCDCEMHDDLISYMGCDVCVSDVQYQDRGGWCLTVRSLALPYADHPDYRDEWRG